MEGFTESLEYFYDEDFSIPFDIGISEENNNSHHNANYNYLPCMDITDDDDNDQDDYDNDELEQVIMPEYIFSQIKSLKNQMRMKRSYETDIKPVESRMSCSSSPNSGSSTANNRLYFDSSFIHNNPSFTESIYSLKSRMHLFDHNYHLHFAAAQDSFLTSSVDQPLSKVSAVTDSGKCSATSTTVDITDDPITFFHGLPRSTQSLKPDAVLWRQIKYLMLYHTAGWSLLTLFKHVRKKCKERYGASTDDVMTHRVRHSTQRSNRYSCTVLELFNALNDSDHRLEVQLATNDTPNIHNFSCQFPPPSRIRRQNTKEQSTPTKNTMKAFDYPGIGRVTMPKPTRLNCSVFLSLDLNAQLSFLQTSISNQSDTTYNRDVTTHTASPSLKPCLRKDEETPQPKIVPLRSTSHKSLAATENFKRKSVSFDCPRVSSENLVQEMKTIPKKWGLHGTETRSSADMLAIFECGRRDSLVGVSGVHDSLVGDDAARFREMVNDVLRSVKQISDRLTIPNTNTIDKTSSNDNRKTFHNRLNEMCELISCGDGLDTPLATAIDNLIVLLSDGLAAASFSSKKVRMSTCTNKSAMRLWLLVEETCRVTSTTPRKSELFQLLRDIRQTVANTSSAKDHLTRLRAFIANALKAGLMHVWLRAVVVNDAALQRFYCPEAFLRQARTGQSDALAALTVSLKTLTSNQTSPNNQTTKQPTPVISKPVFPPPVKIARRFLPSTLLPPLPPLPPSTLSTNNGLRVLQKPLYCEEPTTTESESYADESRSSQSECQQPPPNRDISNNNSIFSRAATHPRFIKKSSTTSSGLQPTFIDSIKSTPLRKPIKSISNHGCSVTRPSVVVSIPMKTFRSQPLSSPSKR